MTVKMSTRNRTNDLHFMIYWKLKLNLPLTELNINISPVTCYLYVLHESKY